VSAREAFAEIEGQCTAPFEWTDAEGTEMLVEVVLDRNSAVEVSYPATDFCAQNGLEVQGDIVLRTTDGKLTVRGRSKFKYTLHSSDLLDPSQSPAELIVSAKAVSSTAAEGRYVVRVGGAGPACAGEIRWKGDAGRKLTVRHFPLPSPAFARTFVQQTCASKPSRQTYPLNDSHV
jgi:hypothetical protein